MKIVTLTDEEEKLVAKLRRDALRAKSGEQSAEVVRAAGTSEGAKKGWNNRIKAPTSIYPEGSAPTHGVYHESALNKHGENAVAVSHHWSERDAEKSKGDGQVVVAYKSATAKASDTADSDVVHCRASSATGPQLGASQPWNPGERVEFMWMPAGVSTICAGFRKGSIELTVQCDEATAAAVQASLDGWREERPKQEPFGCIEHKEQEASFRVGASCGFKWNGDGVYLAAEPTTLGAQNVNGRVHRSWSPSFTTDADYGRASEQPPKSGVLVFPEGVRGSRSNPARITGVDFCVGTLTNKPAFHSMSPVKAKEADAVTAAGTSEGAKKGWEARQRYSISKAHANGSSERAFDESHAAGLPGESKAGHRVASASHDVAASHHELAAEDAASAGIEDNAVFHRNAAYIHRGYQKVHQDNVAGIKTSISDSLKTAAEHLLNKSAKIAKATDAAPSDALHAHCAAQLVQDVPDATEAETAAYEAAMDKGSGHAQAVQELRAARVAKLSASEPPTADSIAAAYEAAVAEANRIAASQGAVKLTAEDVWEQCCTVTAAGNSEGAKKGWTHRVHFNSNADRSHFLRKAKSKHDEYENVGEGAIDTDASTASLAKNSSHVFKVQDRESAMKSQFDELGNAKAYGSELTPEKILEQIYARAGANR